MQAVLIAAIAALAPTLAVIVTWNQQRAGMHRVEDQLTSVYEEMRREVERMDRQYGELRKIFRP